MRAPNPRASLSPLEISRYQAEKVILEENAELGDVPLGMTENLPV
jgi:predicted HTH domain antitoxin